MPDREYSLFINTCDAYRDCWDPFFLLFSKYWPGPMPKIYLNTEKLDYSFNGLDIVATKAADSGERLPWGALLRRGLSSVAEPVILYMHEDYFLQAPADTARVEHFLEIMRGDPQITAIRLQELGNAGPWSQSEHDTLWRVAPHSPYLVSLQAGLWRTERLSALVRDHETPWQFEVWGSKRRSTRAERILCVNRDMFGPDREQILPYPTSDALKKGKWNREIVVELFRSNDIDFDFSVRGFYDPLETQKKAPLVNRALARLRSMA